VTGGELSASTSTSTSASISSGASTSPSTAWRFVDHRRFQRDAALLVSGAAAVGALAWARAWPLGAAAWLLAAASGLVTLLAGLARRGESQAGRPSGRRGLGIALPLTAAGAALAGATWQALGVPGDALALGQAVTTGALAGLAATLALAGLHVQRPAANPLSRALGAARASLSGDERLLAERAARAQERIAGGLGGDTSADGRRLARLSADVTLQVLDLAMRCRSLRAELDAIDAAAVHRRAETLAAAAESSGDQAARADLTRASRAVLALAERARALAATAERVRARLELQVAMLEATALAVAAGHASATVDRADALAPLADRLHEAGGDLHVQAQSLAEATLSL
jgi:hypothetical protein